MVEKNSDKYLLQARLLLFFFFNYLRNKICFVNRNTKRGLCCPAPTVTAAWQRGVTFFLPLLITGFAELTKKSAKEDLMTTSSHHLLYCVCICTMAELAHSKENALFLL
jgi:hypothetical protein